MIIISNSVGDKGINSLFDAEKIQNLLNENLHLMPKIKKLVVDKKVGKLTITAIRTYQKDVLKMINPDGRVDPNGRTLKSLQKTVQSSKPARPANVTAFINKTLADAKNIKVKYKIPVSVLISQAALESGWGRYVKDNAYFGIKAHNTAGTTTSFKTTEFVNGEKVSMTDSFRAYKNFKESAEDYGKFLTKNTRYKPAFAHSNNPEKFAEALHTAGYATDPQYSQKLKSIISTYNLNEYDK